MTRRLALPPAWRQSHLARFDACPLSLQFDLDVELRQLPGNIGVLGARGTLFHRFAAMALNHMREHGEQSIDVDIALELLLKVICQRDVPDEDVVSLPMEQLHWLRVLVVKWANTHRFSIDRIVDVERRLFADIEIRGPEDTTYMRQLTGKPDVLLAGPGRDDATVLDWKSGFAPPARRIAPTPDKPEPQDKLSDMGYVQQVVYGFLVMFNYPAIQRVWLREYYVMAKEDPIRERVVERWEMERIQDVIAAVMSQMDAAVKGGRKSKRWFPVPGSSCGTCSGVRLCPVRKRFGIPETLEEAQRLTREWIVGGEIRKERTPHVKTWVDEHGPVPIFHSKKHQVVGFRNGSRSLSMWEAGEPDEHPWDERLVEVAEEAGVLADA